MSESDDDSLQSPSLADELFECCAPDCISEESIREIIERHKLTPHHNNEVSNYKFFWMACYNEKRTKEIIQYLLEYFPAAANDVDVDDGGLSPIHYACSSDELSLGVIQLLIDVAPDSVHREDDRGNTPLHTLCASSAFDNIRELDILKLLLEKFPELTRHANNRGFLPIHVSAMVSKSTESLSMLIEAYPGSERMADCMGGMMPLHCVCTYNSVDKVEYFYNLHPDAIHHTSLSGFYPIHIAIAGLRVGVVKFLLGLDTNVKFQEWKRQSLLSWACLQEYNSNIGTAVEMIQIIYDAHPEFIRKEDSRGYLPLHCLCTNTLFDGEAACEFLKLFLEWYPESIHHANNRGHLPIHLASQESKSPEFCRLLIEAYPGSERIADLMDVLPLHLACMGCRVATVEYLYDLYPDAIDHETTIGTYPIHGAIAKMIERDRDNQEASVDIVKFLLGCDARVKLQTVSRGTLSLLAWVFYLNYNDDNIGSALEIIKAIYDAHPEAIESDEMLRIIHSSHLQVRAFAINQMIYSRHANSSRQVSTPFENGQFTLHVALQNNARLGSIKLLVKEYLPAVQSPDNSGALPLHLACMHHESASVVQYLVELDRSTLEAVDDNNNTALHHACRGAKYETIALLLGKYDAVSVSRRNAHKKLPIDLLWESNEVIDRESVEYTEVVFQLVKAYPETVMNWA